MKRTLVLLAAIPLVALAASEEVKVESGRVKGVFREGVVSFKGIPFAAAPVGDLRWRPPQPAKPWTDVRPASEFGADCMQRPFPGDAAPLGTPPAEDCLFVNVWAPATAAKKLPVLVWIYGGGFVNGGSSPAVYDGTQFAKSGLVFVSFNYRLGRFGFFAHPALSKENPQGPLGNYGYMDQIAALNWVRKNIAAFGGDPGNVTLFGESAGGGSVLTMMTSPMAKGLIHKAVIQSGGGRTTLLGPRHLNRAGPNNMPSGEAVGVAFAKSAGIEGEDAAALAALRTLTAEAVTAGLNMASMGNPTYAGPMIDGKLVLEAPGEAYAAGRGAKIPVMVGATNADIGFPRGRALDDLFAPFSADAAKARELYPGDFRTAGTAIAADQMMVEPARFVARTVAATGQPAYEYRFSYVAASMRDKWRGAPHATEIPFVFDTVAARYGKDLTDADRATGQAANAYWANFAKKGNPNGPGLPEWPAYSRQKDILMDFAPAGPVAKPDPWKQRLDLVERLALFSGNPMGVFLRCTGLDDPLAALKAVKALGMEHVQVSRLPDRFYTPEGAQEFAGMLKTTGITADAVVVVFAGESYRDRESVLRTVGVRPVEHREERLAYSRKCVDFAAGIGAGIVTFHIGFLPENPGDPVYRSMLDAVTDIAGYAAKKRITISLETGQETGEQLARFLDKITVARVGVNFDPANLVIYGMESPARALRPLVSRVTSVHVKDALPPAPPATMGREVRPGEGRAELKECFEILRKAGFKGPLIIENYVARGLKTEPLEELRRAKQFIEANWLP